MKKRIVKKRRVMFHNLTTQRLSEHDSSSWDARGSLLLKAASCVSRITECRGHPDREH